MCIGSHTAAAEAVAAAMGVMPAQLELVQVAIQRAVATMQRLFSSSGEDSVEFDVAICDAFAALKTAQSTISMASSGEVGECKAYLAAVREITESPLMQFITEATEDVEYIEREAASAAYEAALDVYEAAHKLAEYEDDEGEDLIVAKLSIDECYERMRLLNENK